MVRCAQLAGPTYPKDSRSSRRLCSIPMCVLMEAYLAVPVRFLLSRYGMCWCVRGSRYFFAKPGKGNSTRKGTHVVVVDVAAVCDSSRCGLVYLHRQCSRSTKTAIFGTYLCNRLTRLRHDLVPRNSTTHKTHEHFPGWR